MILVTGATGQFGQAVITFLLEKGVEANTIIALVRTKENAGLFTEKGLQVRYGDYDDFNSLTKAFSGVDKLMFISAKDIAKRDKQHENVVNAANKAGVNHIVYTSSERKTEIDNPLGIVGLQHFQTEKGIRESGMKYTIMRNNLYMDIIPMFIGQHVFENGIYFPAGNGQFACAIRKEMAEAAAVILSTTGHENKEYAISGSTNYTFQDVASALSELSGKEIAYTSPASEAFIDTLTKAGLPKEMAGSVAIFGSAMEAGEFYAENTDLERLIGHKTTTLKDFLKSVYSL